LTQSASQLKWAYGLSALYIVLNSILIANEFFWLSLLPAVLLVVTLSLFSLDNLFLLTVLCTPFAINLEDFDMRLGLSLPTEPIMFGIMLIFIIKSFYDGSIDRKIKCHPITIAIVINLVWIFITSITSELPVVSFKFLLARLWFVTCFYFFAILVFKKYRNIHLFSWLYIVPFTIVIFYTLIVHAQYRFEEGPANWVVKPFYNDHTAYGAMLAMFIPVIVFYTFNSKQSFYTKMISLFLLIIFLIATVLSYTRAAWISLLVALGVYFIFLFKIKFRTIAMVFGVLLALFFVFRTDIIMKLEDNRQDSSSDFSKHIQSMSNISSDASNLERINRWHSALGMFEERPVFGFGPGTYSLLYAPFQRSIDKTIISTNAGNMGNAHSEYIGPLAESGLFGTLSFVLIIICVIYTAAKLYQRLEQPETKALVLALLLGLVTYFVHGALNNFLDTDKASVPFWGFIAIIVAIDIYHSKKIFG